MELEDLFKDRSKEAISAFAYNMGRMLEEVVKFSSGNAIEEKKQLEAKIFDFRNKFIGKETLQNLLLEEFDRHFGIETHTKGG